MKYYLPALRIQRHYHISNAVARASIGGFADLREVVRAVSAMMESYKITVTEALDQLAIGVDKGLYTLAEVAPQIGVVAESAKLAGLPIEELTATIAQLSLPAWAYQELFLVYVPCLIV